MFHLAPLMSHWHFATTTSSRQFSFHYERQFIHCGTLWWHGPVFLSRFSSIINGQMFGSLTKVLFLSNCTKVKFDSEKSEWELCLCRPWRGWRAHCAHTLSSLCFSCDGRLQPHWALARLPLRIPFHPWCATRLWERDCKTASATHVSHRSTRDTDTVVWKEYMLMWNGKWTL